MRLCTGRKAKLPLKTIKFPYWRDFLRQADVEAAVRAVVNPQPFNTAFESPLISQLVSERHYFCRLHKLRPAAFKKTYEDSPYRFYGLFELKGWHPVSWRKCLKQPPSREDIIVAALRNRIESEKIAFRRAHPICAHCNNVPSEETHHAQPSFSEITDRVFSAVLESDIDTALAAWNWFEKQEFTVPQGHVIERLFDEFHAAARLEALCKRCHNATKSSHKTKNVVGLPKELR